MKELDLLLLRYLRERHATAGSDERDAFAEFLELPDPDLVRYLVAGDVPTDVPPQMRDPARGGRRCKRKRRGPCGPRRS